MRSLYAAPDADPDCRVQVMTLHKAKGLEFDVVILPSLDRQSGIDGVQLLNWFESSVDGEERLLLAPFEEQGLQTYSRDPLNRLVRKARQRCDEQEKLRLLYVACTRAKRELHLVARASHGADGTLKAPHTASLLSPLWPLLEPQFQSAAVSDTHESADTVSDTHESAEIRDTHNAEILDTQKTGPSIQDTQPLIPAAAPLVRIASNCQLPAPDVFVWPASHLQTTPPDVPPEFAWASRDARDIGTVVHEHLQRLADPELKAAEEMGVKNGALESVVRRQLRIMGVSDSEGRLDAAAERVMRALDNTLNDERGRWCLAAHEQARSEWALSVPESAAESMGVQKAPDSTSESMGVQKAEPVSAAGFVGVRKVVIDRTFVDEQVSDAQGVA